MIDLFFILEIKGKPNSTYKSILCNMFISVGVRKSDYITILVQ